MLRRLFYWLFARRYTPVIHEVQVRSYRYEGGKRVSASADREGGTDG